MTITHDYLSLPEYYTRPSRKATKYYCGLAHSTLRQIGEMGARSSSSSLPATAAAQSTSSSLNSGTGIADSFWLSNSTSTKDTGALCVSSALGVPTGKSPSRNPKCGTDQLFAAP